MGVSGYAHIHRSLLGHPAFRNDAEAMTFAWMILRAAWRPARVRYKGKAITLARGQLAISVRDLAEAMDRDKAWIERLFTRLRRETMIETHNETGVSVVTICNYSQYQASQESDETPRETAVETDARQTRDTEQEDKEFKKEEITEAAPQMRAGVQPVSEALSVWNETAAIVGWKTVIKFTPARQAALRARLRDDGLDGWRAGIARARASPFLTGDPPPAWFHFDFVVKPGNFAKLIEGNYDGSSRQVSNGPAQRSGGDGVTNALRHLQRVA